MNTTVDKLTIPVPGGNEIIDFSDFTNNEEFSALSHEVDKLTYAVLKGDETRAMHDPLHIESLENDNEVTFEGYVFGDNAGIMQYSKNIEIWYPLEGVSSLVVNKGERLYFRCIGEGFAVGGDKSFFSTSKKFNLEGNINIAVMNCYDNPDLVDGDLEFSVNCAFAGTQVVSAKTLLLPSMNLVENCYRYMFEDCTSLVQAPELPATTLAEYCYADMFYNCISLTQAPELPATTLADLCYSFMFQECTSLVQAPELPATELASGCYYYMFASCTSLVQAPELPATELADGCYYYMFMECTSLVQAPELPATTLALRCYDALFFECTSLVQAPELPATTLASECYEFMFQGCTSLVQAPELPATELAPYCYEEMFRGCTSLVQAPELTATTLVKSCYQGMFYGCTSLNYIICLATDISANNCTTNWTIGVAPTGNFVKDPEMENWQLNSPNGIPPGWSAFSDPEGIDFCIESLEDDNTIGFGSDTLAYDNKSKLEYLTSIFEGWKSLSGVDNITLNTGDKLYLRITEGSLANRNSSNDTQLIPLFISSKKFNLSGDLNRVIVKDFPENGQIPSGVTFIRLFAGTQVVNASDLKLSATTLTSWCYQEMFTRCTSLVTAPELPATVLASRCYYSMFYNCTSLNIAPELPATTLAEGCYQFMFRGCTSLVQAPELPATELALYCYPYMFSNCTSLVQVPELPATELASGCYQGMFSGCTSLVQAPELPATTLTSQCYEEMFDGCTSLEQAPELPATTLANNCYGSMFYGCTSLVQAPALPATTLVSVCYDSMFCRCTSLEQAPELPATTLANSCYSYMFSSCTSLVQAPELPATNLDSQCYLMMFNNCTSLVHAPELPATTLANSCYYGMFQDCYSLVQAPELPATELASTCYRQMFLRCTSLVQAPKLPATTLAEGCYYSMFDGCTSLNYIECLATDISATGCTTNWTNNVAPTGIFVQAPTATWQLDSPNGIPTGWTVEKFYEGEGLQIISLEDDNSIVFTDNLLGTNAEKVEYSTDYGDTWVSLSGVPSITLNSRDYLIIKCVNGSVVNTVDGYKPLFSSTKKFELRGNLIESLYSQGTPRELTEHCFAALFSGTKVVNANKLVLSDTSLTSYCYANMFYNCTELVTAPKLPATELASGCYQGMFRGCTSLKVAPALPATTLASECYEFMFQECYSLKQAPELPALSVEVESYANMFYNCTSLVQAPELPATTLDTRCYQSMFSGCTSLVQAPALPALSVDVESYLGMFFNCTSLVQAPELPATELAQRCYESMFIYCTSLKHAPKLPATTLTENCYASMFAGCTSLVQAPELPATELASGCYQSMFWDCTSLVQAPELPARNLVIRCYLNMFRGCTSLNYIKCLATDISVPSCTVEWTRDVAPTGTFVKDPEMNNWVLNSPNGIPTGWTVYSPLLFESVEGTSTLGLEKLSSNQTIEYSKDNSTWYTLDTSTEVNLEEGDIVYLRGKLTGDNNFNDCTQFKMTGKLAAYGTLNYLWDYENLDTPLKQYCGVCMFLDCTSLVQAPELPATELANYCYSCMFVGCTSLTIAPTLPATTLIEGCYDQMFKGCTSLTIAPTLPATTLVYHCYTSMFYGCTSLVQAPALPAMTLASWCYYMMFSGCTSLTIAPELPATTLAEVCYSYMFENCTSLEQAPELPATTLSGGCYSSMFSRCTSLVQAPELPAMELSKSCYTWMFSYCTSLVQAPALPATTLVQSCYFSMFYGCTSLNYIKCLATDISATDCTTNWTRNVAPTGTFVQLGGTPWKINSPNGIPTGWTVESSLLFKSVKGTSTLGLEKLSTNQTIEYSKDNSTWSTLVISTTVTLEEGEKVYLRGKLIGDNSSSNYTQFKMTGKLLAYGSLNYLWDYENLDAPLKPYCGYSTFRNCTSLVQAPELPATELAEYCYASMFRDCKSLVQAPVLPATTLAKSCYYSMFQGCYLLKVAPELPAAELVSMCYQNMFRECTSLNYIKCLATYIPYSDCTFNWTKDVAPTGTFIKDPEMNSWQLDSPDGIPTGWTVESPLLFKSVEGTSTLGLTSLSSKQTIQYSKDNLTWSNLTKSTTVTLEENEVVLIRGKLTGANTYDKYTQFKMTGKLAAYGSLNYIWDYENLDAPLKEYCGYKMFMDCTSLVRTPELPASSISEYCYYCMFWGCTSLVQAPSVLPATTLVKYCYYGMFMDCDSLVQAPELPATTLVQSCYSSMFYGCPKLNYIKCLATNISASSCTSNWTTNVAPIGLFRGAEGTPWLIDSENGIPTGWTVESPLYFESIEGTSTLGLEKLSSYQTIQYSKDNITWSTLSTSTTVTLEEGEVVYLRGKLRGNNDYKNYTQFKMTGKLAAYGNLNYLWDYENLDAPLKQYCGYSMFSSCTSLVKAPDLPATILAEDCYHSMFWGCSSLVNAPVLPATTLAKNCYTWMFSYCTSLVQAPSILPATTLVDQCYIGMFERCTSLVRSPELPATILASGCYNLMFSGCTSLNYIRCLAIDISAPGCTTEWTAGVAPTGTFVKDPEMNDWLIDSPNGIPTGWTINKILLFKSVEGTSTLELGSTTSSINLNHPIWYSRNGVNYKRLYPSDVTTLNEGEKLYIKGKLKSVDLYKDVRFKMTGKIAAYGNLNNVWDYENLDAPLKQYCGRNLFYKCTSLVQAPELPATELADRCYMGMFEGCTSLVQAPELPATILTERCYQSMFSGCTSINYIKCLATDISAYESTLYWTYNVAPIGTFVKDPEMENWNRGYYGIPNGWTVVDAEN